jgi:hypothetical protein
MTSAAAPRIPSPEAIQGLRQDPEVSDWMLDVDAAETLLTQLERRRSGRSGRASPTRRNSVRSQTASYHADDEHRTCSNLSESTRSNMSMPLSMSGKSPARSAAFGSSFGAATTLLGASTVDGRMGSSGGGSSSSSPSYNTARSSFPALQAEGPSLLMPGRHVEEVEDDDDEAFDGVPGSPSKSKPRRSWLGSLRRVFNNTNPAGSSGSEASFRADSPSRMSLDQASSDYEHRLVGLGSIGGGSLLRRKQGKKGWEEAALSTSSNEPRKSGDTDWDIERAVEQRLVQVMFTVPKEKLRVVNAEIDKEEEAVLVTPTDESSHGSVSSRGGGLKGKEAVGTRSGVEGDGDDDVFAPRVEEDEKRGLAGAEDEEGEERRKSAVLRMPETARLERPRTKVLEIVETIESRSRESTPGPKGRGG